MAKTKEMNVWITNNGFILDKYVLTNINDSTNSNIDNTCVGDKLPKLIRNGHIISISFENSNHINPSFEEKERIQRKFKYLPKKGEHNIITASAFKQVAYQSLYQGIDVEYQIENGNFRFDFEVNPNNDPNQILMKIEGHNTLGLRLDGSLKIGTSLGDIKFGEILAYQKNDGTKSFKECVYSILNDSLIQFTTDSYDKNSGLIIDPTVYATYFGGEGNDDCNNIACDLNNNIYLNTRTSSINIPRGIGKYTITNDSLATELSKISSDGKTIFFTLFLNSSNIDFILTDRNNDLILLGGNSDTLFPTTENAYKKELVYDSSNNEYIWDYYLIKLDPECEKIYFSTFLNLKGGDPTCIKQDHNDDFYIGGITFTDKFYLSEKSIKKVQDTNEFGPFNWDGFVSKISADGSDRVFSSKFGGTREERVLGLDVDSLGFIYVAGISNSEDFYLTKDAIQITGGQDTIDYSYTGFISKLNPDASDFIYSSYFGGGGQTIPNSIIYKTKSQVIIGGKSSSKNFPRGNNYQTIFNEIDKDYDTDRIFLVKFDFDNIQITHSSLLGERRTHIGLFIRTFVDSLSNNYIMITHPSRLISTTEDAYQKEIRGLQVVKVDPELSKILYSSYLGGDGHYPDYPEDMWVSPDGTVYVCGSTPANNFPSTPDALRTYYSGKFDGYFAIFRDLGVVSVENNKQGKINFSFSIDGLFPNPVTLSVNLNLSWNNNIDFDKIDFRIYDVLGNEYQAGNIKVSSQLSNSATLSIPVEGMPTGTYILCAMHKDFNVCKMFVKY